VAAVSPDRLQATVEALAYPRNYEVQRAANERARDWLQVELRCFGYETRLQGSHDNVIAEPAGHAAHSMVLLGAHYDTVPTTPGADDNNSAIAVCLEAARVLALQKVPVKIAIFNCEEVGSEGDGLQGSTEYVASMSAQEHAALLEAHIFEMVGYFTSERRTQSKPAKLPIRLRDTGDFIGVLSNSRSNRIATRVMRAAKAVSSRTRLISLKIFFGLERRFKDLLRSDHTPFWAAGLPALMWTDTSEFRNPHYHQPSDTPDTLDYEAMADVTRIVVAHVVKTMGG
jgi:Zn-dependent M28 family amino/carboxypeptidase